MQHDERRITFLKILIAAAWADEHLSAPEIRSLSYYLQRLKVTAAEYETLRPLLERPIRHAEAEALVTEQLRLLSRTEDQRTLVAAVEDLLTADDQLTPGETRFLRELRQLTHNLATPQVFIARLKTLWDGEVEAPPAGNPPRLAERFLQQRLLDYFRGRIALGRARAGLPTDAPDGVSDRDLYRVVLWAGLLGRVADADDKLRPAEKDQLLDLLRFAAGRLPEPDLNVVAEVSLDGSLAGIELDVLSREYLQLASDEEADLLLDSLFLVAAADGQLQEPEVQVIRQIARGAGFDEAAFRGAFERCRARIRSGWN